MKINLGFSQKRYTRDMSFDANTTFGFGEVQPLMSQFMLPDSDIKVSSRQLVRLAPLIAPSFARVKFNLYARFIPCAEVCPAFESILSNIPFKTFKNSSVVPTALPNVAANAPFVSLLYHCTFTAYSTLSDFQKGNAIPITAITEAFVKAVSSRIHDYLCASTAEASASLPIINPANYTTAGMPAVNKSNYDFLVVLPSSSSSSTNVFAFSARSVLAKNLLKVFKGLGYDMPVANGSRRLPVSILPILSFYKAYFETFNPCRDISFTNTSCYSLIQFISEQTSYSFSIGTSAGFAPLWYSFVHDELSKCFYSQQDDYLSVHTSKVYNVSNNSLTVNNSSDAGLNQVVNQSASSLVSLNSSSLNDFSLRAISLLTTFVSKDSVIGQRMSEWVRTHFNADIANSLFKQSSFVGKSSIDLNISDVFSTADTVSKTGGEHLGAFAGKGIGYGDGSFRYHSTVHGYFIIFACVAPQSRTNQGVDPTLFALDRFSLPQPEFDALGYEVTDRTALIGSNGIAATPSNLQPSPSFGFIPRYSSFKFRKNLCNGDMFRESQRLTLIPYFLDRDIRQFYFSDSPSAPVISSYGVPNASAEWRYITKYPYLGNFNRLFINSDNSNFYGFIGNLSSFESPDNFICQVIFNVSLRDSLKPLKSSFDTFDKENDTSTKEVESV